MSLIAYRMNNGVSGDEASAEWNRIGRKTVEDITHYIKEVKKATRVFYCTDCEAHLRDFVEVGKPCPCCGEFLKITDKD